MAFQNGVPSNLEERISDDLSLNLHATVEEDFQWMLMIIFALYV